MPKTSNNSPTLAAYLRLSKEDEEKADKAESNSITNQRQLIESYIMLHPELASMEYTEYIDDGYTGLNTARPSFQEMMKQAKEGKIQCIVVKDMSRLSRNYLTLGDYVEQLLPMYGVRFISINDTYDSKEQSSYLQSMSAALQGLVYAQYSRDLSNKKVASITSRIKNGTYISHSPYGYITNWKEYRLEMDPDAATVIRLIFDLTITGYSTVEVAHILNNCRIPTPHEHAQLHPEHRKPWAGKKIKINVWTSAQIRSIIQNRTYTGTLQLHKTTHGKGDSSSRRMRPEEEWLLQEDAHEAIISKEEFVAANRALPPSPAKNARKPQTRKISAEEKTTTGIFRCGRCGATMAIDYDCLLIRCPTSGIATGLCTNHSYSLPVLEDYILYNLKPLLKQATTKLAVQQHAVKQARSELKKIQLRIMQLNRRREEMLQKQRLLFESFSDGKLPSADYISQKQALRKEADTLQNEIDQCLATKYRLSAVAVDPDIRSLAQKADLYQNEKSLTRNMVTDFVDSVCLCDTDDYHIQWRYQELFERLEEEAKNHMLTAD